MSLGQRRESLDQRFGLEPGFIEKSTGDQRAATTYRGCDAGRESLGLGHPDGGQHMVRFTVERERIGEKCHIGREWVGQCQRLALGQ